MYVLVGGGREVGKRYEVMNLWVNIFGLQWANLTWHCHKCLNGDVIVSNVSATVK